MLEVRNLEVYIGKTYVLKDISFSVPRGEIVALIGANGTGKTTTLSTITGLLRPRSGSIFYHPEEQYYNGLDRVVELSKSPVEEIVARGVSLCPEGRQIFTSLSVRENLMIGAYLRTDRNQIRQDMEYVYSLFPILSERQTQVAGTLSGGEQMMLAIGRALMGEPQLLLLDEPSLGLAPLIVEKLFELLKKIREDGVTILLVEQNAFMALEIADRAYVLETGRVTLSGTGKELLENESVRSAYLGV